MNATVAAVTYALKALLDPEVPNNQAVIDCIEISAPRGSLLNAVFPAPVAARAHTCQRIIDVVLGALAPALPDRAPAAGNGANTTAVFSGIDPRTGEGYLYLETLGGGAGGWPGGHGKDGVQVGITNTSNLPVEAIETEYPLMVERYGLLEGSGGAGAVPGRARAVSRRAAGRARLPLQRRGRALYQRALGPCRRRARRPRPLRAARRGRGRNASRPQALRHHRA